MRKLLNAFVRTDGRERGRSCAVRSLAGAAPANGRAGRIFVFLKFAPKAGYIINNSFYLAFILIIAIIIFIKFDTISGSSARMPAYRRLQGRPATADDNLTRQALGFVQNCSPFFSGSELSCRQGHNESTGIRTACRVQSGVESGRDHVGRRFRGFPGGVREPGVLHHDRLCAGRAARAIAEDAAGPGHGSGCDRRDARMPQARTLLRGHDDQLSERRNRLCRALADFTRARRAWRANAFFVDTARHDGVGALAGKNPAAHSGTRCRQRSDHGGRCELADYLRQQGLLEGKRLSSGRADRQDAIHAEVRRARRNVL